MINNVLARRERIVVLYLLKCRNRRDRLVMANEWTVQTAWKPYILKEKQNGKNKNYTLNFRTAGV